ncbi:MAG: flagella basal body P-ring formation protein FlgA [Novosphingobium sp.]|uniref:flagella basal body P-ring formation protein FlgA n=1 Tax=Novosphingobium sp. TaxID=1874826 RepID=UPI003C7D6516
MIRPLATLLALGLAAPVLAQATADLDGVDRAVAQFTGAPLGQPGGAAMPTDRRLRLAPCRVPLALSWHGLRRESVEVLCPMPGGWRLYVPLAGAGPAARQSDAITRGDAVTVTVMGQGFAVSQSGEALESGPVGAWIKVRTVNAGAPVLRGKVLRPGAVGIDLP